MQERSSLIWYPGHELLLTDIVRAEGCHVFDASGRSYLDLECGVWCAGLGHAHPRLQRVTQEQAMKVDHTGFNFTARVVEDAAREILALMGFGGGACVFLCSGSEAVEYGVRVARMVAERPLFLTLADSYFGAYGSAARRGSDEWCCFDWLASEDPDTIRFPELGGFLLEPGSSSGLVRFPPAELVQRIARTVQDAGGFVLVNEVTTGCGRTGEWFGFQHYGITPDVVALGKGIGNGYPVSVTAFSPRIVTRLAGRPVPYAQSHQNDPVGAAVAREVVRIIRREDLVARSREMGHYFLQGLREIASLSPGVRDVRGRGLMMAVELADQDGPEMPLTRTVHRELVRRGFLVGRRPGVPVLRIDPPLIIDRGDAERFLVKFAEVLERTVASAQ